MRSAPAPPSIESSASLRSRRSSPPLPRTVLATVTWLMSMSSAASLPEYDPGLLVTIFSTLRRSSFSPGRPSSAPPASVTLRKLVLVGVLRPVALDRVDAVAAVEHVGRAVDVDGVARQLVVGRARVDLVARVAPGDRVDAVAATQDVR